MVALPGCAHWKHEPTCCYWHEGAAEASAFKPGDPLKREGDEIVAAGQLFHTGTRIVLWTDPPNYDAYRTRCRFDPEKIFPSKTESKDDPNRYNERGHLTPELAARVKEHEGWTLADLQEKVDQFVIHFDVCGTSRQCFKILHDVRGLSVQFMCDVDGTIYQTLDLKERAWQATKANDRSVGVEIAQIGCYPNMKVLDEWYGHDNSGWPFITLPKFLNPTGIRTPDFVGKPARKDVVKGKIHGHEYLQYDFTNQQYEALIKLSAALNRVFPKLKLDAPRDAEGNVLDTVLSDEAYNQYEGFLGHYHVQLNKTDPGPAFDWSRVLEGARRERARLF